MAKAVTPAQRKPLTKREAGLFAKIYAASVLASVENFDFEGVLPEETEQLAEAMLTLSNRLYEPDTMSNPKAIFNHILSLRTDGTPKPKNPARS